MVSWYFVMQPRKHKVVLDSLELWNLFKALHPWWGRKVDPEGPIYLEVDLIAATSLDGMCFGTWGFSVWLWALSLDVEEDVRMQERASVLNLMRLLTHWTGSSRTDPIYSVSETTCRLGSQSWMGSDTHAQVFMGKKALERAKNVCRSCLGHWEE